MIDIHSHILPNVDHGAKHMQESVKIAQQAAQQGVDTIIATPNHLNGKHHNPKQQIMDQVEKLNNTLIEYNIPVTVLPGQRIRLHGDLIEGLEKDQFLTLRDTSEYLLIDLPSNHLPNYTMQLIYDLQLKGYKPIFSEPTKNVVLQEQLDVLYDLVKKGALIEISAPAVTGQVGKKVQRLTKKMMEHNLVHFIGSGVTNQKEYLLKDAIATIQRSVGREKATQYVENATALIQGKAVIGDEPIRPKKKKILGLFG
ncbi:Tyrosine-protein phosphatase YwqE [Paraliobacillus sp. PM-2]|uniref:tyrosine-protein phosphatase n=1 Tax=Paraliobacillus sp. PM-2 TaxID=1462524 RepID=UPI00061C9461|nr:CpsB/CapC family capsule biosynthesis tyrosine phosphatase [Paraliobacillus sp. PM-2]CQR46219.1 Tyrosine-protein phosphatase YwqE [Paraliobacillus sp. PM-2]